jgi:peptidoglycan/xylan/chitin deacetylase (PgdA/CDA1 family)
MARRIALTYDDGPGPYTEALLDVLAAKNVPVTFFLVGSAAASMPGVVERQVAEGHAIGNHSWDHPHLTDLSDREIAEQVDRSSQAIHDAAGQKPILMRPPYGNTNDAVSHILRDRGMGQILWDVDSEDWRNRDTALTTAHVLDGAHDGAIVLMHDIHESTVAAAPGLIDLLRADGYTLLTVPQLLGGAIVPGETYVSG